jgi:hypothetical protein
VVIHVLQITRDVIGYAFLGYCHAPRADSQAGWRLDRNYLVVDSGGR